MRKKILQYIYKIITKYKIIVLTIATILTLLSLYYAKDLRIETDLISLLPSDSSIAKLYDDFGSHDYLLAVIEVANNTSPQDLIHIAEEFSKAIYNREFIYPPEYKIDSNSKDFFLKDSEKRVAQLLTDSDYKNIQNLLKEDNIKKRAVWLKNVLNSMIPESIENKILTDPLNIDYVFQKRLMHSEGPLKINLKNGYYISPDGKMLLVILKPKASPSNYVFTTRMITFLKGAKQAVLAKLSSEGYDAVINFAGNHIESYNNSVIVKKDLLSTVMISFIMVIGLFMLAFRRMSALFVVGLPLLIGLIWTLGITAFAIGHLSIITFSFAAILIGLGVDFAVHIYNRFCEEMLKGKSPEKSIETTLIETGEAIFMAALTTSVAFYGLMLTNFKGFQELGFISGTGILCCFVSMSFILPTLLLAHAKRRKEKFIIHKLSSFGLGQITQTIGSYPRHVLAASIIITVYLGYHAMFVKFDTNLDNLKQPVRSYQNLLIRLNLNFILPSSKLMAVVEDDTLQGALEKNDKLYNLLENTKDKYGILAYDSIRTILPSIKSQKEDHEKIKKLDLVKIRKNLRFVAVKNNLNPDIFNSFLKKFYRIQKNANTNNFINLSLKSDEEFQRIVRQFVVHKEGKYKIVTNIYPIKGQWDQKIPDEFIKYFQNRIDDISFTGLTIASYNLQQIIQKNLALAILLIMMVVFILLYIHFLSIKKSLLAISPVVCSFLWMLGTMNILGIKLNYLNIIIAPILIGIGLDNGIYIMQRFYEKEKLELIDAIEHTGRAIVVTSLTTMIGFGSLITANFHAIAQIGILTMLGIGYELLASLTILPAVLKIWGKGFRLSELIKKDEGLIK